MDVTINLVAMLVLLLLQGFFSGSEIALVNADKLKLVGPSISSDQLGFIYPKGSDLVEPINAALTELAQNGFLEEVNLKYFGPDFDITYDDLFPEE